MKLIKWKESLFPRGTWCESKTFAGAQGPSYFTPAMGLAACTQG